MRPSRLPSQSVATEQPAQAARHSGAMRVTVAQAPTAAPGSADLRSRPAERDSVVMYPADWLAAATAGTRLAIPLVAVPLVAPLPAERRSVISARVEEAPQVALGPAAQGLVVPPSVSSPVGRTR